MPRAPGLRRVQWVKPELVAEVAFSEWTPDGRLRHPSFQGLRDDKPASAVVREHPAPVNDVRAPTKRKAQASEPERPAGVTLTNPTKVLVADVGLTKLALAQYYETVAASMLPHLHGRALMLLRCPDGSDKPCFFQKHAGQSLPDGVIAFNLREQDGTRATYLAVESAQGLVGTVQMGALELHVWGSRRDAIDRPDRLVIDLDPDEELPFANVVIAASEVRDRLADAQLESFVMSTGGKGLHVVAPLDAVHPFEVVKAWARRFAEQLVRAAPTRYVATASKARRRGKIFLDYLRNGRGASAVCPFSTRSRPGAPVAVPLAWEELADMDAPPHVGIDAAVQRVTEGEDPWAGYFALEQRL
jgi:bifunctional non-homologous end joining protein LigD